MTACAGSDQPLIQSGLRAACPDCGNMVVLRLVGGVWAFPRHEDTGVTIASTSGDADRAAQVGTTGRQP